MRLGQIEAAELCANEARQVIDSEIFLDHENGCFSVQVFPLSYLILYLKGAIHQARAEWREAKSCYQNALSIYPRHLQSLQVTPSNIFMNQKYFLPILIRVSAWCTWSWAARGWPRPR